MSKKIRCFVCNRTGHYSFCCPSRKCYNCGNLGHIKARCPLLKDNEKQIAQKRCNKRKNRQLPFVSKEMQWAMCRPLAHKKWRQAIDTNRYIHLNTMADKLEQHLRGVQCLTCLQYGHFAKDCPNPVCFACRKPGHWYKECPKIKCFYCNQNGHTISNCQAFKRTKGFTKLEKEQMLRKIHKPKQQRKRNYQRILKKYIADQKKNSKLAKKEFKYTIGKNTTSNYSNS